jgi:hypothetical protein
MVDQGTNGMVEESSVQCGSMRLTRNRRIALLAAVLTALLTTIPYLISTQLAPGASRFSGFLINPVDGFSYLAKMRQGMEGNWTFLLPYASVQGPRSFLFVYYILLGHLSRLLSIEPILTYHLARFLAAVIMFYLGYLVAELLCSHRHIRRFAYSLMLFSSGLGWLALGIQQLQSSDMLIPESIPFLVAYSNPHFPLAAAAILSAIYAILVRGWKRWQRLIMALISGFVLGAVLPFSYVSLLGVLVGGIVFEGWIVWRFRRVQQEWINMWLVLGGSVIGALPWMIYDFWLSETHPILSAWNSQNLTLSPRVDAYLIGFAPLVFFSAIAVIRVQPWKNPAGRLMIAWIISGALLLYAPVDFQRRLSLGLAFPLCILAAWGWGAIGMKPERRRLLAVLVIALMSTTNLLVISAGLSGVSEANPAVIYRENELESYRWIAEHVPVGSLVLAGERTGNRIPAFASVRVLYGHPFETPDALEQLEEISFLYGEQASLDSLHGAGISWVYRGNEESLTGDPAWLDLLTVRWSRGSVTIYEVPPR